MNFKQKKRYIKTHKKIDMQHFDSVAEVMNMLDLVNNEINERNEDKADGDIHSISQFLARLRTQKRFFIESK